MDPLLPSSNSSSSGTGSGGTGGTGTGTGSSSNGSSSKNDAGSNNNTGIEDENVLLLVFRSINFDPRVVSVAACVSRRLRAVASRVLWRELCFSRAPRMAAALAPSGGGWHALAKLLFFCCGSSSSASAPSTIRGHFAPVSRFSKTSGRSFLPRRCSAEDVLYVSDPCEHAVAGGGEEDVGLYRGVFRGFMRSRTRAGLIARGAQLEGGLRCPYCGARVWSMAAAGLVPRSASRRLGSHEGSLDYFVCINGHLHGNCWLAHLSDDGGGGGSGTLDSGDDDDDDDDGHVAF